MIGEKENEPGANSSDLYLNLYYKFCIDWEKFQIFVCSSQLRFGTVTGLNDDDSWK